MRRDKTGRTESENGELLGRKDRNRLKNRIKRSGQARLVYVRQKL